MSLLRYSEICCLKYSVTITDECGSLVLVRNKFVWNAESGFNRLRVISFICYPAVFKVLSTLDAYIQTLILYLYIIFCLMYFLGEISSSELSTIRG